MNPRIFWPLAVVGFGIMGFGVLGLFHDSARTHPDEWIRWFLGSVIVHDLVLAPVVFIVGRAIRRTVPTTLRSAVTGALVASAISLLILYPLLRGYGRDPNNPSVLPLHYARNLLIVLGTIWSIAALVVAIGGKRRAAGHHPPVSGR